METILTSDECMKCEYGTLDATNKAKPYIKCSLHDKTYHYGLCMCCDDFRKRVDKIDILS